METWIALGWATVLVTAGAQSLFYALNWQKVAHEMSQPAPSFWCALTRCLILVSASVGGGLLLGWAFSFFSGPITETLEAVHNHLPPSLADPMDLTPPHVLAGELATWIEEKPNRGWISALLAFVASMCTSTRSPARLMTTTSATAISDGVGRQHGICAGVSEKLVALGPWFVCPILPWKG